MGHLIEIARLGGEIVRKAIALHKAGSLSKAAITTLHSAVSAAHDAIHTEWTKLGD